jgi:hypothetical protein
VSTAQEVVIIGVALVRLVLSSMALWLRLFVQLRSVRERRLLLTAATALPAGSPIHVFRGDGTHVVLILGGTRQSEGRQ